MVITHNRFIVNYELKITLQYILVVDYLFGLNFAKENIFYKQTNKSPLCFRWELFVFKYDSCFLCNRSHV